MSTSDPPRGLQPRSQMPLSRRFFGRGYSDGEDTSEGMRGFATGDNWAPEIVNAVATVLAELKEKYHPRRSILVGHSGGAAIVGNLMGQPKTAADGALLVSCLPLSGGLRT